MSNINDILAKLLKPEEAREVSEAVSAILDEKSAELEKEYDTKLQEAFAQLVEEKDAGEKIAEQGYQEAYGVITDLRNRLETLKTEADKALEEGYEEAYQLIQAEKSKNETLEVDLLKQYDEKLNEMREFMIDKLDEFLEEKGKEIYEQARRDTINDPRFAEHRIALNKVVDTVSEYMSADEFDFATANKLEQIQKENAELASKMKLVEARNIRLNTENTKLNESVRQQGELLKEGASNEKKERTTNAQNVTGRGRQVGPDKVEVIGEAAGTPKKDEPNKGAEKTLSEGYDWSDMAALAGLNSAENK